MAYNVGKLLMTYMLLNYVSLFIVLQDFNIDYYIIGQIYVLSSNNPVVNSYINTFASTQSILTPLYVLGRERKQN